MNCSTKDVQKAYRKLVKKYHPDLNKNNTCPYTINQITEMRNNLLEFISKGERMDYTNTHKPLKFKISTNIFELRL